MMKYLLTSSLFFGLIVSTFAQEMNPPKQITDLGWMVGTWTGSGKIAFGNRQVELSSTMTVSFDGWFLKSVSVDQSSGFALTKTTMTGWDSAKARYVSYTFTNISPMARIESGTMDGNKLVMVSEPWEAEGMKLVSRESMSKVSGTKLGLFLEAKVGDKWQKEMDFVLTKKQILP